MAAFKFLIALAFLAIVAAESKTSDKDARDKRYLGGLGVGPLAYSGPLAGPYGGPLAGPYGGPLARPYAGPYGGPLAGAYGGPLARPYYAGAPLIRPAPYIAPVIKPAPLGYGVLGARSLYY